MRTNLKLVILACLTFLGCTEISAQESPDSAAITSGRILLEIPAGDQLTTKGWQQAGEQVWRKMAENGAEVEISFGQTAKARLLDSLTEEIAALREAKGRSERQDIELLQLLIQRDEVEALELVSDSKSDFASMCTGNAEFEYWFSPGFGNPTMDAQTTFTRWVQAGVTATSTTRSAIIDFSTYRQHSSTGTSSGTGLVVPSWASISVPTWICLGYATGKVTLSGGILSDPTTAPTGCLTVVEFNTPSFFC